MSKLLSLHGLAYSILKTWPETVYPWSESMKEKVTKADMGVSYVVYISSMFFWTIASVVLGFVLSFSIVTFVLPLMGIIYPPLTVILIVVSSSIILGGFVFFSSLFTLLIWRGREKRRSRKTLFM